MYRLEMSCLPHLQHVKILQLSVHCLLHPLLHAYNYITNVVRYQCQWANGRATIEHPLSIHRESSFHQAPSSTTVEVVELWTVFHEHYSLLGQSSNMGCCISTDHRFAYKDCSVHRSSHFLWSCLFLPFWNPNGNFNAIPFFHYSLLKPTVKVYRGQGHQEVTECKKLKL